MLLSFRVDVRPRNHDNSSAEAIDYPVSYSLFLLVPKDLREDASIISSDVRVTVPELA